MLQASQGSKHQAAKEEQQLLLQQQQHDEPLSAVG